MVPMKLLVLALASALYLAAADPTAIKEVTAAMEALKQAMLHKDRPALEKLTSDDLTYTHSGGELETKAQFVNSIASGKSIVERLDYFDMDVRIYGNTALAKAGVDLYHSNTNIVHMNVLHVWAKGLGGWKMVARQATRLTPPKK